MATYSLTLRAESTESVDGVLFGPARFTYLSSARPFHVAVSHNCQSALFFNLFFFFNHVRVWGVWGVSRTLLINCTREPLSPCRTRLVFNICLTAQTTRHIKNIIWRQSVIRAEGGEGPTGKISGWVGWGCGDGRVGWRRHSRGLILPMLCCSCAPQSDWQIPVCVCRGVRHMSEQWGGVGGGLPTSCYCFHTLYSSRS